MFVREFMTPDPITVSPDVTVPNALRLLADKQIRRLPVVDEHGKLVGIVTDSDLLHASPSPVTSLAIWEITDLLSRLKVAKVMTRDVVTVQADTPLEEAALVMADHRIGCLPVMRGKELVGIITESDLFRMLLELLGGRRDGVRVTVSVTGEMGTLARISNAVFDAGGDIVGLGVGEVREEGAPHWEVMLKVQGVARDKLVEAIRPTVDKIVDARETG